MDWSFVAKKALNIYFEDFLENKDHSIAQNSTNKLIKLFATKAGFKFIDLSSNKIPQKHLIVFFTQFAESMYHIQVDKNYIKGHDRRRLQFNTNYSYDLITVYS